MTVLSSWWTVPCVKIGSLCWSLLNSSSALHQRYRGTWGLPSVVAWRRALDVFSSVCLCVCLFVNMLTSECMYVCIKTYVRAAAYSLDCHEGAMINCRLYRTFQSLSVNRTETVTSSCRELPSKGRGGEKREAEWRKVETPPPSIPGYAHAIPDRQTNNMAITRRFVLTNASHAKNGRFC